MISTGLWHLLIVIIHGSILDKDGVVVIKYDIIYWCGDQNDSSKDT